MQWVYYYPIPLMNKNIVPSKTMEFSNNGDSSKFVKQNWPSSTAQAINNSLFILPNLNPNTTGSSADTKSMHANFIWNEDEDFSSGNSTKNHTFEISPLFPLVMVLIISTLLFIVIVYRRWPGLCAGIIAGCLTSISVYMLMITLKEQRLVYE